MPLILPTPDGFFVTYPMNDKDIALVSDGYHTFEELYEHRFMLFLALCRALGMGWKSTQHADGSMYDGWFVAGVTLPLVGQISYHLPLALWEEAGHLDTVERAPSWDGHTPADVCERLRLFATLGEGGG